MAERVSISSMRFGATVLNLHVARTVSLTLMNVQPSPNPVMSLTGFAKMYCILGSSVFAQKAGMQVSEVKNEVSLVSKAVVFVQL